ncbi:MAG: IS21 family transposase [Bifidobacteriaceae bacterium]|jgi:transposase|nr:IS21 family transposase [Bifidobacteriaceae bacterium]
MVDYKRILQLRAEGVSQRGIADVLGCSRNTVAAAFLAARTRGVGWEDVAGLDSGEARRLLLGDAGGQGAGRPAPDFEKVHREMGRRHVTLTLLWAEYCDKCRAGGQAPYAYSYFTEQYRTWAQVTGATMRMVRSPGEAVEVDWAGDPMAYADAATGEPREAWLFVAALPYSAYAYVEAFADMRLGSWVDAHVAAFEHFGGAARILVPDNLRAGVSKADRYEPALNPAYARCAEHYGTAVVPARVGRPRDKSLAEGSVRHVAYRVAAALRDRRFVGLAELNEAVFEETGRLNAKPFQKREDSRLIVFERDERALLRPLPKTRFELADLRKAKVGPNYHVQVLANFYSAPSRLIGQTLDVRVTSHTVELFDGPERVASHPRLKAARGAYSTVREHMPAAHRHQLADWSPARFEQWAATVGPFCVQVVQAVLASHKIVEQSYRSCLGLLSLAKKNGGKPRLEEACRRALDAAPNPSYTLVKKIWSGVPDTPPRPPAAPLGAKGFVRGAGYYARGGAQR